MHIRDGRVSVEASLAGALFELCKGHDALFCQLVLGVHGLVQRGLEFLYLLPFESRLLKDMCLRINRTPVKNVHTGLAEFSVRGSRMMVLAAC